MSSSAGASRNKRGTVQRVEARKPFGGQQLDLFLTSGQVASLHALLKPTKSVLALRAMTDERRAQMFADGAA
jgi:hypothetical protein